MAPELKTLTVVSPVQETITMRPQQLLHVVLVGHSKSKWLDRYSSDPGRIRLKSIRQETLQCDGFPRNRKGNFKIAFHSYKMRTWQSHYWFRLNPADIGKLDGLGNGNIKYDLASLAFRHPENGLLLGELNVQLKITDIDREEYFEYISQTVLKNLDPLAKEAAYVGLGGRHSDQKNGYLFNPGRKEQFSLKLDQRSMMIELPEPTCRFNGRWKAIIYDANRNGNGNISMSLMPPRMVNNIPIHRFQIQNLVYSMPSTLTSMRSGKILFSVHDENNSRHVKFDREVELFVVREREKLRESYYGDSGDECVQVINRDAEIPDYEYDDHDGDADAHLEAEIRGCRNAIQLRWEQAFQPRRSKIEISERDCGGDLESGETCVRVSAVKPTRLERLEIFDVIDGQVINLPDNKDLVIVMDRGKGEDYGAEVKGNFLKIDLMLADGKRQRYSFTRRPRSEHRSDTEHIYFTWGKGKSKKTVHCKVVKVQAECTLDCSGADYRYSE